MTLFDAPAGGRGRVVRVVPDVPAMDRELDYLVPPALSARVDVGSVVRIPLHGRRVRGWVVADHVEPATSKSLSEVAGFTGIGPDAALIELCRWAAWRWAARLANLLRVCTPDRAVRAISTQAPEHGVRSGADPDAMELLARGPGVHLLSVAPDADPVRIANAAAALGQALILGPLLDPMKRVASALEGGGTTVARWPSGMARSAAGHTLVGGRSAVWARMGQLSSIVVWDEHDEGLQNEASPTWHAREVAIERAARSGVPCLLVSPCPSLEARRASSSEPLVVATSVRRAGWAPLVVADRRGDDPRTGLYSESFVDAARTTRASGARVVCVLNRTGRARLLACRSCGTVAECHRCGSAVHAPDDVHLLCAHCGSERPTICLVCGSTAMRVLRAGITRAAEDLEALLREPAEVVSAKAEAAPGGGLLIGTEAVLHRVRDAALVSFLDFDQELLAPRYRAAEEALALLVHASRLVRGRRGAGRILVQTRRPGHPVLDAARRAAPEIVSAVELPRRRLLGMPPVAAVAVVGGEAAPEWIDRLGRPDGVEIQGPRDDWWLLRAESHAALSDACAAVRRPAGRLRLRVDPVRLPG